MSTGVKATPATICMTTMSFTASFENQAAKHFILYVFASVQHPVVYY